MRPAGSLLALGGFVLALAGCPSSPSSPLPGPEPGAAPTSASPSQASSLARARAVRDALKPLQRPLPPRRKGDWLERTRELGQSFEEWLEAEPTLARGKRRVLYVQPIGPFSPQQRKLVNLCRDYLARCYGLQTRLLEPLGLEHVPAKARRVHPSWKVKQLLSTYLLDSLLAPRLPADAAALIGFTAVDLYPEPSWNFVFGQASLRQRVGVWSLYRHGDPAGGAEAFRTCLRRTLQTAVHETGHMFSIQHCTAYACVLGGSNSLSESDRQPLWLCAEDTAKVLVATGADPQQRVRTLEAFCREQGLSAAADHQAEALKRLAPP